MYHFSYGGSVIVVIDNKSGGSSLDGFCVIIWGTNSGTVLLLVESVLYIQLLYCSIVTFAFEQVLLM